MLPPELWEVLSSNISMEYRIFRTRVDRLRAPRTGVEGDFIILEAPDWVNAVALTPDQKVILVRQYRHGVRQPCLEIPGGMVDPGEEPMAAARRELLEETGYAGEEWRELGWVHPNPAIQNNRCYTYVVRNCRSVAPQRLDSTEDLRVELVDLEALPTLVARGEITHALVVAAFYLFSST